LHALEVDLLIFQYKCNKDQLLFANKGGYLQYKRYLKERENGDVSGCQVWIRGIALVGCCGCPFLSDKDPLHLK
jgi:hypothetical protein